MSKSLTFLVLGGARSGKTRHAMQLALRNPSRIYIATAEAYDDEMRARIARHKDERDASWSTLEAPLDLTGAMRAAARPGTSILVDCLTLWLSNLMAAEKDVANAAENLVASIAHAPADIIFVSNEVGMGIVPANALAREFRDAQGHLNQRIAQCVDHVDFVAAGLALNLKPGNAN